MLSPGARQNIKGMEDKFGVKRNLLIAPQRPKSGSVMEVFPAILRNTMIWSSHLQRPAHYLELFEVMGYPIFEDDSGESTSFAAALMQTPQRYASSMVGNGMHVAAIGCCLLFILACKEPVK